jgi:hypothetical protein
MIALPGGRLAASVDAQHVTAADDGEDTNRKAMDESGKFAAEAEGQEYGSRAD